MFNLIKFDMKNFFIAFVIVSFALNLNAQWRIGGSIGLNVKNINENAVQNNDDFAYKTTEVGFLIAPKAYYHFTEKFALGLGFSIGPNFLNLERDEIKSKRYSINWRVYPFVRYSIFTYKKFALILEGRTGVGGNHSIEKYENNQKIKANTIAIGVFNITPVLSYNLTDHFQIEAGLHFLNVGYNIDIYKREEETSKRSFTKHDFNIGFNSSSILVATQLSIGAVYKF
jgi:hypothetical protein